MPKILNWKVILLILVIVLALIRLALPFVLTSYINHKLAENPALSGKVESTSLSLILGEMRLHDLTIRSNNNDQPKFEMAFPLIDAKLNWARLFRGKVDFELMLQKPTITLLQTVKAKAPANKKAVQPAEAWMTLRQLISTFPVNAITMQNGAIHYIDKTEPQAFDLYADKLDIDVKGLRHSANQQQPLPGHLGLLAHTVGEGAAQIQLDFNLQAPSPTFSLKAQLEHVQLNELNPLFKNYTGLSVKQGTLNFYLEAVAQNGYVKGYSKPLIEHLEVTLPPEEKQNPFKKLYKGTVNWLSKIFTNKETQKAGTQAEFQGKINDPNISLLSIVGQLLKNAFIEALLPKIDFRYSPHKMTF